MKKILAIFLSVLLICAAIPFAVATAAEEPTIALPDLQVKPGDVIEVPILLKNNPGIVAALVKIEYDKDVLELVSYYDEDEEAYFNQIVLGSGYKEKYVSWGPLGSCLVNYCHGTSSKNYTDELLATATFKVKEDAAPGTYDLTVVHDNKNFFNCKNDGELQVDFAADHGTVTVLGDEPVTPDEPSFTEPTIVVPHLEAEAGDVIEVPILLKNNPGIIAALVKIEYDKDALELVTYFDEDEEEYYNQIVLGSGYKEKYVSWGPLGSCLVNYCHGTSSKNYTDELFATATFKVKEDATPGTYDLTIIHDNKNFFNCKNDGELQVDFAASHGSVTVIGETPCEHEYDADCDPECNLCGEIRDIHTEGVLHFDAVEAGCHYIGNIEYWYCPKCECFWADEALTQVTNSKNVIVPALGGEVAHIEAVAPGCHYNGNIEYWVCYECEQVWQDEALTQLTNSKNVILPAIGGEVEHVEAKDPTCSSEGNIEYWFCAQCEQYWQDEALTQLTNSKNVKIGLADHNIVHFDAVEPGCHYIGNIEYWFCTECEIFWADEALTKITNSKSVILPMLGGDVAHIEANAPACHYNGNIEYWYCAECEQFWQDEALTQITNSKNVILPALESTATYVPAVDATCESVGNVEYWFCDKCEQVWTDEALTQLSNLKNVKIGVLDHNIIHMDAVEPGCHYNGNIEYWFCADCGAYWADEALTQVTNSKSVILPAKGGETSHIEAVAPGCHYNGNIEYWVCYECEQVWQDEALTQLTNSKNVILPALESTATYVPAKDATCTEFGNVEYWTCDKCEQVWTDEALTQLSNIKNVTIAPTHTNLVHMEAVEAGCHYIGNVEYWVCYDCGAVYTDEALTEISNIKNVIIPAKGGETIHFEAVEPGCHYIGNIEYWYCAECDQYWADEALTLITNAKSILVPATGSDKLQHVEAKDPTCLETGNVEYWYCSDCEQVWTDAALTQLSNLKNVVIATLDHNIVHIEAVESGCHYIGNIEYWYCSVCGTCWQDEALTQITNVKNVIVPAKGGDVIAFEAIEPGCHYNGRIAYWYCAECDQFWQDEALTQLTNSKNVILPATGSDKLQHVEAKAPTATENGNVEYWFCGECEQVWVDEALTQLSNLKNVIVPATGEVEPDSPVTGDSTVAVVVALLTLIASGLALVVLKNKNA